MKKLMGYEEAQRLGFDTLGFFSSNGWMEKYDTKLTFWESREYKESDPRQDRFIKEIKLPIYVDFQCLHGEVEDYLRLI